MKTNDVILQFTAKIVFFMIFFYAVHIFFAGHYTPGGGFVGGLVTASAIVLLIIAFDIKTVQSIIPINYIYSGCRIDYCWGNGSFLNVYG